MQLRFHSQRQHRIKRTLQYTVAFFALAISVTLATVWLIVASNDHRPAEEDPSSNESSQPEIVYTAEDTANLLVIIQEDSGCHFALVQANPAKKQLYAVPLPTTLSADGKISLVDTLHNGGAAKCMTLVREATALSVDQYVLLDAGEVESYLSQFEKGVTISIPQAVYFVDKNGAKLKLSAGENNLNATQVATLLRYNQWQKPAYSQDLVGQLLTTLLNAYFNTNQNLAYDFYTLSNLWQSTLRIHHFSAYKEQLQYLADSNQGKVCQLVRLSGAQHHKLFIPNVEKCRKATPLYS